MLRARNIYSNENSSLVFYTLSRYGLGVKKTDSCCQRTSLSSRGSKAWGWG